VRVGVIGTNWGRMHIGAFRGAGAEVVALCGRDLEKTRRIAAQESIGLATTDVAELCAACELVVVASPDAEHARHANAALDAGRHLLCEKPLAFTASDARALANRPTQSIAAVGFPYRMLPPFAALHRWSRTRAPRALSLSLRNSFAAAPGREASGDFGGLSHLVDAALWLMNAPPVWVQSALLGAPPHSVTLSIGFKSGGLATITQLASEQPGIWGDWRLHGEGWDASVCGGYVPELGGWRIGPTRSFEQGGLAELSPELSPVPMQREPWAQAHLATARELLSVIAGAPRAHLATLDEGARVQEVLAATAEAHSSAARVILR
jgi:myo-inositol 2-dehydrogenase/D-chiro-inositol 1-dehydrogenase